MTIQCLAERVIRTRYIGETPDLILPGAEYTLYSNSVAKCVEHGPNIFLCSQIDITKAKQTRFYALEVA